VAFGLAISWSMEAPTSVDGGYYRIGNIASSGHEIDPSIGMAGSV
jgi:hypothetical protein